MTAQHLETVTLPMILGVGERNVMMVKAVLSALTKLPALKTFILDIYPYQVRYVVLIIVPMHVCIIISANNHIITVPR